MPHPSIQNGTPFVFEHIVSVDQQQRPLFIGILKATFRIHQEGRLTPLREQPGLCVEGEYYQDVDTGGYRYEPENGPMKPATDIVLIGTAVPPNNNMPYFDCGIRLGEYAKILRVFGTRQWRSNEDGYYIQPIDPAIHTPLVYSLAYGGKDQTIETDNGNPFERRNPIGIGYHHPEADFVDGANLPLIESPNELINDYYDSPAPAGVGFIGPHWLPRAEFAGTYDEIWQKQKAPALPDDFNEYFHNAASPGLIAHGYLNGNENVSLVNIGQQKMVFNLPGMQKPKFLVETPTRSTILEAGLDTVIINTDDMLLHLIYRAQMPLDAPAHNIRKLAAKVPGLKKQSIAMAETSADVSSS